MKNLDKKAEKGSLRSVGLMTEHDVYLFREGTHTRLYDLMGSHLESVDGQAGCRFAVWAPNAEQVTVIGDFNGWDRHATRSCRATTAPASGRASSPAVAQGDRYKYHIVSRHGRLSRRQGRSLRRPLPKSRRATASRVWDLDYALGRRRVDGTAPRSQCARRADVDLRGAPRLVAARARRGQPLADLPRDGAAARRSRQG